MMPGSQCIRAALRWLSGTPAVAPSRPHLHQLSLVLLCEAHCFDSEEFHPGRQPSGPDVFLCWLIYCLAGTVGTPIWLPVSFLAGCLLCARLTRAIHAYLKESNALLVQMDLLASQLNLRGLWGSLQLRNCSHYSCYYDLLIMGRLSVGIQLLLLDPMIQYKSYPWITASMKT